MKKTTTIGGQAVMDGVMMKSAHNMALAVRKTDGTIAVKKCKLTPWTEKNSVCGLPVVRGAVLFADTLVQSIRVMTDSVDLAGYDEEEPTRFEKWISKRTGKDPMDIAMAVAVVLAVLLSIFLYVVIPTFISKLLSAFITSGVLLNFIEGVVRMLILVAYLFAISLMKDVRRMLEYHGAEHKTIACYEAGLELTPENARGMSRLHPRCGTSFLFLVMLVSIFIFICLGTIESYWIKLATRILMIPVVAGFAYEALKALSRNEGAFCRAIRAPGLKMQKLTTQEPDDAMLEVSIAAFRAVLDMDAEDREAENRAIRARAEEIAEEKRAAQAEAQKADAAETPVCADGAEDARTEEDAEMEGAAEIAAEIRNGLEQDADITLPEDLDIDI